MEYFLSTLSNFQLVAPQLAICALALLAISLRNRSGYPLPYIAVFFAYFTLGPVLNWTMNADVYVGTVVDRIPTVTWWYAAALTTWAVMYLFWRWLLPARHLPTKLATAKNSGVERTYWGLDTLNILVSVWAAFKTFQILSTGATDKLLTIEAAGAFHYDYLLIQVALGSAAILTWKDRGFSPATWINLLTYSMYCLVTFERDFIFVIFALLIHITAAKSSRFRLWIPFVGIVGVIGATAIFVFRSEQEEFGISTILGQGSNLFIDTFILEGLTAGNFYPIESY
ncbi:hypothetical protein, partial [Corynebacterium atrinae]